METYRNNPPPVQTNAAVRITEQSESGIHFIKIQKNSLELEIGKFFDELEKKKPWVGALSVAGSIFLTLATSETTKSLFGIPAVIIKLMIISAGVVAVIFAGYRAWEYWKRRKLTREVLLKRIIEACPESTQVIAYPPTRPIQQDLAYWQAPSAAPSLTDSSQPPRSE